MRRLRFDIATCFVFYLHALSLSAVIRRRFRKQTYLDAGDIFVFLKRRGTAFLFAL